MNKNSVTGKKRWRNGSFWNSGVNWISYHAKWFSDSNRRTL